MSAPWLGFVTPLLVRSATQFAPRNPPPALTSARYTRDFIEVKAVGSATSTVRTAAQTSTALFFSGNSFVQDNAALRDQVSVRHLDIVEAARMFAAIDMSVADAVISVWHAKYDLRLLAADYRDQLGRHRRQPGDGRRSQLGATVEPRPRTRTIPAGTTSLFRPQTHGLENLFQTRHLQLTLISTAVPGSSANTTPAGHCARTS